MLRQLWGINPPPSAARVKVEQLFVQRVAGYAAAHGVRDPGALAADLVPALVATIGSYASSVDTFGGHVFQHAHHRVMDELRSLAAHPPAEPFVPHPSPLDVLWYEWVVDTVAQIDEPERSALLLRVIGGLRPGEIAAILDLSLKEVWMRQRDALAAIERTSASDDGSLRPLQVADVDHVLAGADGRRPAAAMIKSIALYADRVGVVAARKHQFDNGAASKRRT